MFQVNKSHQTQSGSGSKQWIRGSLKSAASRQVMKPSLLVDIGIWKFPAVASRFTFTTGTQMWKVWRLEWKRHFISNENQSRKGTAKAGCSKIQNSNKTDKGTRKRSGIRESTARYMTRQQKRQTGKRGTQDDIRLLKGAEWHWRDENKGSQTWSQHMWNQTFKLKQEVKQDS